MNASVDPACLAPAPSIAVRFPAIGSTHKQITAVGSRVTCNPAPQGTDQDWLVYVAEKDYPAFAKALLTDGWEVGGSMIPADVDYTPIHSRFNSFTKDEDNVIATASPKFHRRFLAASSVAKRLNVLNKQDRIALFQAVLYGTVDSPAFEVDGNGSIDPFSEEISF